MNMKKDIHPKYNKKTKVVCACGNEFTTGSTMDEIHIELCSNCHPFFTGKQKLVDTAGRVDKFKHKIDAKAKLADVKGKKAKKVAQKAKQAAKKDKTTLVKNTKDIKK